MPLKRAVLPLLDDLDDDRPGRRRGQHGAARRATAGTAPTPTCRAWWPPCAPPARGRCGAGAWHASSAAAPRPPRRSPRWRRWAAADVEVRVRDAAPRRRDAAHRAARSGSRAGRRGWTTPGRQPADVLVSTVPSAVAAAAAARRRAGRRGRRRRASTTRGPRCCWQRAARAGAAHGHRPRPAGAPGGRAGAADDAASSVDPGTAARRRARGCGRRAGRRPPPADTLRARDSRCRLGRRAVGRRGGAGRAARAAGDRPGCPSRNPSPEPEPMPESSPTEPDRPATSPTADVDARVVPDRPRGATGAAEDRRTRSWRPDRAWRCGAPSSRPWPPQRWARAAARARPAGVDLPCRCSAWRSATSTGAPGCCRCDWSRRPTAWWWRCCWSPTRSSGTPARRCAR